MLSPSMTKAAPDRLNFTGEFLSEFVQAPTLPAGCCCQVSGTACGFHSGARRNQ
jgi:hypothetical protein